MGQLVIEGVKAGIVIVVVEGVEVLITQLYADGVIAVAVRVAVPHETIMISKFAVLVVVGYPVSVPVTQKVYVFASAGV